MSTQAVVASLSGPGNQGGRKYSATATDGAWNSVNTTTGSSELGFAQKGRVIDNVNVQYAAGSCAWRILDRVTQMVVRAGFGCKLNKGNLSGYAIAPVMITQDMVFQVYPLAAGTKYLAWVQMKGRPPEFFAQTVADAATAELVSVTDNSSIGSYADQTLTQVDVQSPDGKVAQFLSVLDGNGGEVGTAYGTERFDGTQMGAYIGLCYTNVAIPIMRGMTLNLTAQA